MKPLLDPQGHLGPARPLSDHINARVLAAGVSETMSVPPTAKYVFICGSTTPVYFKFGASAAVPTDLDNGSASEVPPPTALYSHSTPKHKSASSPQPHPSSPPPSTNER
jgi:hypothetical protein